MKLKYFFENYLKEIIYGGNDGIVTTFAVVAGFSGASFSGNEIVNLSFLTVLLFGLANLFADATSMGLGEFLSLKSEKDLYSTKRQKLIDSLDTQDLKRHVSKTETLLLQLGYKKQEVLNQIEIYKNNKNVWAEWLMLHELNFPNNQSVNPIFTGIATFLSFIFFGIIPLLPYIFLSENVENTFLLSIIFTFLSLCILGFLKGRVVKSKMLRAIVEIVIIGGASASVAFIVGIIFKA